ncbi:ribonuclease catalytic domain-containing protein [Alysiella filiformis]|uniref:Exoribonuclease-2 n=1 Tax=Alysiella filiformis DSM 16848 TaxID=1120981 RepID=A0A286EDU9_9NEIS|nr:RNB domain-containing ribonuclease [Alysiella filiformis]QMT31677.1 RNB domain-containing ribonuclease [Alysiella filiformis]UBQ55313.1 RNB domain-containing ribonuclease [Alysiella filiformis DSM 16848]SOD69085.1 exoribonuclease-2 [Alysiella filiformis DSM 16848]
MANIFYEESGQFKAAQIVQKNDASYQADTQHGKRVKIKTSNVFFEFNGNMDDFMQSAQAEANDMDTELLWESVGADEFSFESAAQEYFGAKPNTIQQAATLMALYAAPMYFHKKNKGIFKAAPEDVLKQALAAIERKAQQDAQMQSWADALVSGSLPDEIATELPQILHAPDKQSLAYKAFHKAADALKMSAYELAKHTGGITSVPQYLLQRFEIKYFPRGTSFPQIDVPTLPENLQVADVQAFSIDDLSTTEVDDALSVQDLGNGVKRVGIHIAAPALGIQAASEMEDIVLQRLSTVYFPANKITMLPENWVGAFSLDEGKNVPAFSIYFDVDADYQLSEPESRIELVPIVANLRIQNIEPFFNSETGVGNADNPQFPFHAECLYLLELAQQLQKQRDRFPDPSLPKKYDYGIDFDENDKVIITRRERGSPIDTLVSEMMILANTSWAKLLHDKELGGLFRVQPSGRVRMSTHSEPHIGMNVAHYGWFTSPLRRACDYINQKQLQAALNGSAPRFAKNDSDLFVALNNFETAYTAYRAFQDMMESYWAMVWLQQENVREINAVLLKDDLVRLEGVPLVARATGIPMEIAPKSMLKLAVQEVDTETQFVALKYLAVVPNAAPVAEDDESA